MFWTRLAKSVASFLSVGRMEREAKRELVYELAQRLPMPTITETGADWCIDYVTCETVEGPVDGLEASGTVYWLAGGGEFDRYSCEVKLVGGELEYCFVFYKQTKNRNCVRLMAGASGGEEYCEFFAREGTGDWWTEEARAAALAFSN